MSRRVSLPGADELFRPTPSQTSPPSQPSHPRPPSDAGAPPAPAGAPVAPSGRVRHDEKITVYVSTAELLDLEHTRLALRRDHGLAVDRGRLVREAIHLVLEDAADRGSDSALVRRLTES